MYKAPLFPVPAVPVLNTNWPLTPAVPALAVMSNKAPLVFRPTPDTTDKRPPLSDDEVPADNTNSPPAPLSPDPTVTYTAPPRPDVADPVPMYNTPLLPLLAMPVLNTNWPLTPDEPALDVYRVNGPELVNVL
jgi:hypothetical protein